MTSVSTDAIRARRAQGAMFLFAFGGAWLAYYVVQMAGVNPADLVIVALVTVALLSYAYRRYRQNRLALAAESSSPARKRSGRIFNIVNAVQWILICIASSVLVGRGLSVWLVPCVIFIVGLHLFPLAYAFDNSAHYFTGAALIALSVSYPLLSASGPASPIGSLGAALILWASGCWAITANNSFKPKPLRDSA